MRLTPREANSYFYYFVNGSVNIHYTNFFLLPFKEPLFFHTCIL